MTDFQNIPFNNIVKLGQSTLLHKECNVTPFLLYCIRRITSYILLIVLHLHGYLLEPNGDQERIIRRLQKLGLT